jgi:hypothetical protein
VTLPEGGFSNPYFCNFYRAGGNSGHCGSKKKAKGIQIKISNRLITGSGATQARERFG